MNNDALLKLIDEWQKAKSARLSSAILAKNAKIAEDKLAGAITAQLGVLPVETVIDSPYGGIYLCKVTKYRGVDWDAIHGYISANKCPEMLEKRLLQSYINGLLIVPPGIVKETVDTLSIAK